MISFISRKVQNGADAIGEAVREFNENNLPHGAVPDVADPDSNVLGLDANLPLVVRELAPLQLDKLRKEMVKLEKRKAELEAYEKVLMELMNVVNK